MPKVIWALFDDGNCSYKKAIEKYFNGEYEVHCVGINEPPFNDTELYKYHKIDLSVFNSKLITQLEQLPKPDIILASPPCESWSNVDTIKKYQPESLIPNNKAHYDKWNAIFEIDKKVMLRDFYKAQACRLMGEATQLGLSLILEHFKPQKWVIENPASSRCWLYQDKFLNLYGYGNKTFYNCYGFPIKKPTIFKSNIQLNLRQYNIKSEIKWENVSGYDTRSKIPEELIKDIVEQLKKEVK